MCMLQGIFFLIRFSYHLSNIADILLYLACICSACSSGMESGLENDSTGNPTDSLEIFERCPGISGRSGGPPHRSSESAEPSFSCILRMSLRVLRCTVSIHLHLGIMISWTCPVHHDIAFNWRGKSEKKSLTAMGSSMKYRVTQVALVRQVGRNGLSLVTTLDQSSRSDSKGMNGRNQPNRDPTTPVSLAMAFAKALHHSWNSCPLDIHSSSSWIWFKLIRSMILCSFRGLWLEDYSVCSILFCLRMV